MNDFSNAGRFGTLLTRDPMRLLDQLMVWQPPNSQVVWSAAAAPVSAQRTDDGVLVTIDMPGVAPEDIDMTFQAGKLAITGKRGERTYSYSVVLGDQIDRDRLDASLDKGVLTVHAHARPEAKPRKIAITGSQKSIDVGESK